MSNSLDPMDCSTPGFLVLHYLPEFVQSHIHRAVMPSNHLILCHPLLLPLIFPIIRDFSSESSLHIRWPKYWCFDISPSNEYSGLISSGLLFILLLFSPVYPDRPWRSSVSAISTLKLCVSHWKCVFLLIQLISLRQFSSIFFIILSIGPLPYNPTSHDQLSLPREAEVKGEDIVQTQSLGTLTHQ